MRVTCSTCATSFEVGDGEIGPSGATVRCPTCSSMVAIGPEAPPPAARADGFVPNRTISLDAEELTELEDDALIELDDGDVTLTQSSADPPLSSGSEVPSFSGFDIDVSAPSTTGRALDPFEASLSDVETTPPMPASAQVGPRANSDYSLPYEDTVVGVRHPADTNEIDVSAQDLEEEQTPLLPDDTPFGAPVESPFSDSDISVDSGFDVLNIDTEGATPEEATLIVRKRRTPRQEEAARAGLAPDQIPYVPDDLDRVERTQPRVRQQQVGRAVISEQLTDPAASRPTNVSFSRQEEPKAKRGLLWGSVVVLTVAAGGGYYWWRNRPIAPPEAHNPLEQRADDWRRSGGQQSFAKMDDAAAVVIEGIASGTNAGRDKALVAARAAVAADPHSAAAVSLYARALAAREEPLDPSVLNDVLGAITSVIGEAPSTPERSSLETSRAWLLLHAGRIEDAREAAARAVTTRSDYAPAQVVSLAADVALKPEYVAQALATYLLTPEVNAEARLWVGEAQLQAGLVNEAIATWKTGLRDVPADAPFIGRLARLQADLGDFSTAADLLAQNIARGAASLNDVLLLARIQARALHKPKNALETLEAAQNERSVYAFAVAHIVAERVSTALSVKPALVSAEDLGKLLSQALASTPDVPHLIYAGGLADIAGNQQKRAIEAFEAAQTLVPEAPEIAFALASLIRATDPTMAYEAIAAALKEHPDYIPLHLLEATIAAEHDDKTRAVTAIRKALSYDPALYAQYVLFSSYAEPTSQLLDVARALGEQGVRLDNPVLRTGAGVLYVLANDSKNGPLWLTKALRDDPNDVGARLYSAVLNWRRGAKKPARADLLAAERIERRQPIVRLYKARVLEMMTKPADAAKIYHDLIDQNAMNAAAHVGLARVLRVQGDENGARDASRRALAIRPRDRDALRLLVSEVPRPTQPATANTRKSR